MHGSLHSKSYHIMRFSLKKSKENSTVCTIIGCTRPLIIQYNGTENKLWNIFFIFYLPIFITWAWVNSVSCFFTVYVSIYYEIFSIFYEKFKCILSFQKYLILYQSSVCTLYCPLPKKCEDITMRQRSLTVKQLYRWLYILWYFIPLTGRIRKAMRQYLFYEKCFAVCHLLHSLHVVSYYKILLIIIVKILKGKV